MDFYERIEELRNKEGLSQAELEKLLDFSNGSISKWKNSVPKADRLLKIARHFNVTVDYILTGETIPEGVVIESKLLDEKYCSDQTKRFKAYYDLLNESGKEKTLNYMSDLVASGNYAESKEIDFLTPVAAHHSSYKEIPEEEKKHDLDLLKDDF